MSQFHSDDFRQARHVTVKTEQRARVRGVASLLSSLLFFIPLLPLIGVCMGVSARSANRRGDVSSPLPMFAVVFGLVFTIVQAFAGVRGFGYYQQMTGGPGHALASGFGGDATSFSRHFASESSDDAVRASFFLQELRTRFGEYRSSQIQRPLTGESLAGPHRYLLVFDDAIVNAEASLTVNTGVGLDWFASKLDYMVVLDAQHGNLVFPVTKTVMVTEQPDVH